MKRGDEGEVVKGRGRGRTERSEEGRILKAMGRMRSEEEV